MKLSYFLKICTKRLWVIGFVSLCLTACTNLNHQPAVKAQCFWMENYSGKYSWVQASSIYQKDLTQTECFRLDSCSGGMGESGGGCYKWATSPDANSLPW